MVLLCEMTPNRVSGTHSRHLAEVPHRVALVQERVRMAPCRWRPDGGDPPWSSTETATWPDTDPRVEQHPRSEWIWPWTKRSPLCPRWPWPFEAAAGGPSWCCSPPPGAWRAVNRQHLVAPSAPAPSVRAGCLSNERSSTIRKPPHDQRVRPTHEWSNNSSGRRGTAPPAVAQLQSQRELFPSKSHSARGHNAAKD